MSSPLSTAQFQPAEKPRRRGLASLVLLFVLPAAIFGGIVAYGHFTMKPATLEQGTPGSLVWGDGKVIFSNKQQLAAWLRLHGSSYSAFVKRHPDAMRLVTARPSKHVPVTKVAAKPVKPVKAVATPKPPTVTVVAQRKPSPRGAAAKTGGSSFPVESRTLVFSITVGLGLLLGVFALLPPHYVRRIGFGRSPERLRDLRFSAAAVSLAMLAGVGFAVLVG